MTISLPTSPDAEQRIRRRSSTPPVEVSAVPGSSERETDSAPTMNILFQCPRCKKVLCVSDKAVGMTLPCTDCNTHVEVLEPAVHFNCIKCNCELSAFGDILGKSCRCPDCQEMIAVPESRADTGKELQLSTERPTHDAPRQEPSSASRSCPFCGETILRSAIKCKHCGEFLDDSRKGPHPASPHPFSPSQNPRYFR